jgi:ubiquinol-cytochrome c reductase iron-sulfur subunit
MSDQQKMDKTRRNLLVLTSVIGGAASAGAAVPFAASMWPSERARAAGAPVEVDISRLGAGELAIFEWRGKPVWVMRRTEAMLAGLKPIEAKLADPRSEVPQQPDYARNDYRSIKPELMVVIGVCTHLGCSPQTKGADATAEMGADWTGGFYCPCHGSKFDLAGRVFKGSPAPTNLEVPPYTFVADGRIVIGEDKETKGA